MAITIGAQLGTFEITALLGNRNRTGEAERSEMNSRARTRIGPA